MSRSKKDQSLTLKDPNNIFSVLHRELADEIISHSSIKDTSSLICASKTTQCLFSPKATPDWVMRALACVVQGDPDKLASIAKHNPDALFGKSRITDPYRRIFFKISPYQLTIFLCDADMKKKIDPYIPERLNKKRQEQYAELGVGGADLIKLSFDPLKAARENFKTIIEFKTIYTLSDRTQLNVTFPLFENKDAIIYYQDKKGQVNFYYANRETKAISELNKDAYSQDNKEEFDKFKDSFDDMEDNSSRRSSDKEHQLIESIFKHKLHRDGILYEQDGIRYRDSRTSFPVVNVYRKSLRLYQEAEINTDQGVEHPKINAEMKKAHQYWCKDVGQAQGVVMWVLQRICEERREFYPLPANFDNFKRGAKVYHPDSMQDEDLCTAGKLVNTLGTTFALYKGPSAFPYRTQGDRRGNGSMLDLIAICWLIENGKTNVIEELQEENALTPDASLGQ